ncbi:MAG: isoamylase early set domain-containing protein [Leeuwenhoekiella sp.]
MPISKQFLKSKPLCKVTFTFSAADAESVSVAGEFNDWTEVPMKKLKNGNFKAAMNLPVETSYEFKYLVDGNWVNDSEADSYKWNEFAAAENGVISL